MENTNNRGDGKESEKSGTWLGRLDEKLLLGPKLIYFFVCLCIFVFYLFRAKFVREYLRLPDSSYGDLSGGLAIAGFAGTALWSWTADKLGRHKLVASSLCILIAGSLHCITFVSLPQVNEYKFFYSMAILCIYGFFVGGLLPLADYMVMRMLSERQGLSRDIYSRQCLFGTVAYGVASYSVGWCLKHFGLQMIFPLQWLACSLCVLVIMICGPSDLGLKTKKKSEVVSAAAEDANNSNNASSKTHLAVQPDPNSQTDLVLPSSPDPSSSSSPRKRSAILALLLNPSFLFMLIVVFMIGTARAVKTTFISKYWQESMSMSDTEVGVAAICGVVMEGVIFAIGPSCVRWMGVHWMLIAAQLSMCFRGWLYVVLPTTASPWAIYGVELSKGLGFGFTQIAGTKVAADLAPPELQATALALYTAAYSQLPAVLASFGGGRCYQWYGASRLFLITAVMASIACILCTLKYLINGNIRLYRKARTFSSSNRYSTL